MIRSRSTKMVVRKIRIANYRSFADQVIDLDDYNVIIGANAAGKSNLTSLFQFLKDTVLHGLDNAISMQGGVTYVRNINIGSEKPLEIEIEVEGPKDNRIMNLFSRYYDSFTNFKYTLNLSFHKKGLGYSISKEELRAKVLVSLGDLGTKKTSNNEVIEMEIIRERVGNKIKSRINTDLKDISKTDLRELRMRYSRDYPINLGSRVTFLEAGPFDELTYAVSWWIREFSIYDFDPKICKQASQITGKAELEPNGSNLALILNNIMKSRRESKRFTALLKSILPFIDGIKVERRSDKSLLASIDESYSTRLLPAPFISDGTMNLTALIIALYFDEKPFIVIEEPGRSIHPHLISIIVRMMKDVSDDKQIIITTHNPEVVRHSGIANLLLLKRTEKGYSEIVRPVDSEEVKTFLSNDLGLDDLYIENLLEW